MASDDDYDMLPSDDFEQHLLQVDLDALPRGASHSTSRLDPAAATKPRSKYEAGEGAAVDYRDSTAYNVTGFGEGGLYLANKRRKLDVQNQALFAAEKDAGDRPQIFAKLGIYVNGLTTATGLSLPEFYKQITLHGGLVVPYLDRKSLVTHIVAEELTPTKMKEFAKYKVARPKWITDSVKAGRLLPWHDYSTLAQSTRAEHGTGHELDGTFGALPTQVAQPNLFNFGVGKGGATTNSAATSSKPSRKEVTQTIESLSERGVRLAQNTFRPAPTSPFAAAAASTSTTSTPLPLPRPRPPPPPAFSDDSAAVPPTDANEAPTEHFSSYLPSRPPPAHQTALLSDPSWLAKHTSTSSTFLQTYFEQSRLHHLSTWKEELKLLVAQLQPAGAITRRKKLTGTAGDDRIIFHVDFDCFFVAAGLTTRPELRGKPVAVCHAREGSDSSTSEIASCSYEARAMGVKNGIALGRAREMCPEIQTMPFEFDLYKNIASDFYRILLSHAVFLQAVSIDEVLMEVKLPDPSSSSQDAALEFAHQLRAEILAATGCEASIGVGHNILLARLASRRAKPASAFHLTPSLIDEFLAPLPVKSLPGIGWSNERKLEELGVTTVGDIRNTRLSELGRAIGETMAKKFHAFSRGVDARELDVGKARKSVSAEVNYGIRFNEQSEVERFVRELGAETARRLREEGLCARLLTLKVMVRHPDAPVETPKFLGHGYCTNQNLSSPISGRGATATDDSIVCGATAWELIKRMNIAPKELRGIGVQLSKLEKDGRSVDIVMERGQGTLSFGVVPKLTANKFTTKSSNARPVKSLPTSARSSSEPEPPAQRSPSPNFELEPPPPGQDRTVKKEVSILILSDSDSDDSSKSPPLAAKSPSRAQASISKLTKTATTTKAAKGRAPHVPAMFAPNKRAAPPPLPSTSQVDDDELIHYDLHPEVYHALPRELQSEQLAAARLTKRRPPLRPDTVPKKPKMSVGVVGPVSKPFLNHGRDTSRKPSKSKSPVPPPDEVEPAPPPLPKLPPPPPPEGTDDEVIAMDWRLSLFRSLKKADQRSIIYEYRQTQRLTVTAVSAPKGPTRRSNNARDVQIRPPLTFQGEEVTADSLRDFVEEWFDTGMTQPPVEEDTEAITKILEKCVDRSKGCDFSTAIDVFEYWGFLMQDGLGKEEEVELDGSVAARAWWRAYHSARERVDEIAKRDYQAVLGI